MIEGVIVTPLRQILDERGKIMHMMRRDSPVSESFGEIYFSCIHPGAIKAWHVHKQMTLNYAVPHRDPDEIMRRDPFDAVIGYDWQIRHG